MSARVHVLFPLPCNGIGPSHICRSVCRHMQGESVKVRLYTPRANRSEWGRDIRQGLPRRLRYLPWSMVSREGEKRTERLFLNEVEGSAAYLWSEVTLDIARVLRGRGVPVIREKFNCHKAFSRRILEEAYSRIGVPAKHGLDEGRIQKEREELALADWIMCPNGGVRESLLSEGVEASKLIDTSYGWDPARFSGTARLLEPAEGMTVVFVGYICVRKGAHLLLEAWEKSKVKGRLLMIGSMEPTIAEMCKDRLNRADVIVAPFSGDVGRAYRSADVFAFPSLEEGGPLVVYEAMGHGLASLVSPMGAGRGVRDEVEGRVMDPYNVDAWAAALAQAARDVEWRRAMGEAGRVRANEFTWERVGAQRRDEIAARLGRGGVGARGVSAEPGCGESMSQTGSRERAAPVTHQ